MIHARATEHSIAEYINIIGHVGEPWRAYPYVIHIWAGLNFHEGPSIYVNNKWRVIWMTTRSHFYTFDLRERERESVTRDTCSHLMEHGRFDQGEVRNFYLRGPSCSTNIFIKTTSHIHIYTCFFIIYTFFYLISYIYIYTHKKKNSLVFSIKIMFDGNFS